MAGDVSTRWWKTEAGGAHESVFQWLRYAEQDQQSFNQACKEWLRMYTGRQSITDPVWSQTIDGTPIDLNVIGSVIRTLRAKITKNRPAVMAVTDGASQSLQDKAEGLTRFISGVIYQSGGYEKSERVFDDACIHGRGAIKVYQQGETIKCERVYPWEIFVLAQDAQYGEPRTLAQVKHIDKETLAELYPDHEAQIEVCSPSMGSEPFEFSRRRVEQLKVCECWHLPTSESSDDGRHVIAIENATLLDELWERPRFPFAFLTVEPMPVGWGGLGIVEELGPLQQEVFATMDKIQAAHNRLGNTWLGIESGCKVNTEKLADVPAQIIEFTGTPPVALSFPVLSPEVYQYLESLVNRMYQISGTSQLTAQSQKQPGLNSGAAIRTQHDIESERFSYVSRAYERFFIDLAELFLDEAHEMGGHLKVLCKGAEDAFGLVDWASVKLDRDAFILQLFPTSFLPSTPAGRMETISDMVQSGIITPQEGRVLLDMPDLKGRLDPYQSSYRLARYQIDRILKDGEQVVPETYQDLQTTFNLALAAYCNAQTYQDIDEERLELLRTFIGGIQARMQPAPQPAPAAPMPDSQLQAPQGM